MRLRALYVFWGTKHESEDGIASLWRNFRAEGQNWSKIMKNWNLIFLHFVCGCVELNFYSFIHVCLRAFGVRHLIVFNLIIWSGLSIWRVSHSTGPFRGYRIQR